MRRSRNWQSPATHPPCWRWQGWRRSNQHLPLTTRLRHSSVASSQPGKQFHTAARQEPTQRRFSSYTAYCCLLLPRFLHLFLPCAARSTQVSCLVSLPLKVNISTPLTLRTAQLTSSRHLLTEYSIDMLRTITLRLQPATRSRWYSQLLAASGTASASAGTRPASTVSSPTATAARYPYYIPRNTQGSIPVYTDYRNHNRVLTLIRNVEGNVDVSPSLQQISCSIKYDVTLLQMHKSIIGSAIFVCSWCTCSADTLPVSSFRLSLRNFLFYVQALVDDLTRALFEPGSSEAARLKVTISRGRHVALQGGNWKREVMKWLEAKGF